MKKSFLLSAFLFSLAMNAQTGRVGINTENPKATLHIEASASNPNVLDGVIPPTLLGNQLKLKNYTIDQKGAIVYVTAIPNSLSGQVIEITSPGLYYFDGAVWKSFSGATPLSSWLIAGNANTTASNNFIGTSNNQDIVFKRNGVSAGWLNAADNNTSFGVNSMPRSVGRGRNNTALGGNSLSNVGEGSSNVAVGYWTLSNLTSGAGNTAVGVGTMNDVTTGEGNTSMGEAAGRALTTGQNNTFIGISTGMGISTGSQNVQLGPGNLPIQNGSNQLALGNLIFGKNLDANAILTNVSVPGMVGIATPNPTSTLDTKGSVAVAFKQGTGSITLGEKDHTVLTTGASTVQLASASTCLGRTYVIIYGSGPASIITTPIKIGGGTVTNYQISSNTGNRGITLQSDGIDWYATNIF